MKRFFFSLIALSAAVVGCTQSALLESPEIFNQEVSFSPYTGRTPVTKATDIVGKTGLASAGGFQVYCFLDKKNSSPLVTYIDDAHVTSNDGETWSYNKLVYWPDATSQSTLSFVAYSSNAVNHLSSKSSAGFTFTVPSDIDQQVDLLATAYQEDLKLGGTDVASDGKVTLNFHHLLSRVGFKVQTTTVKSVTINALSLGGKMVTSGSLSFTSAKGTAIPAIVTSSTKENNVTYSYLTGTETDPATTEVISGANTTAKRIVRNITNAQNQTVASEYMMIMPQTVAAQGDVTINITYTIGTSPKSKSAKVELPAGFVFAPGKAYEFILNISTSAIKFTVTEDDWGNPTEDDKSYPLIPTNPNKVSANVKVTGINTAEVILTPNEANLGTIGFKYAAVPVSGVVDWNNVNSAFSFTDYTKDVALAKQEIASLSPNTSYVYCTYSTKSGVTTHYSEGSFVTKADIQVALEIDGGLTNIYSNSIDVHCTYPSSLTIEDSKFGFTWVQGGGLPIVGKSNSVNGTAETTETDGKKAFKATITGLEAATEYTCRAYIEVNGVISYSDPLPFTTAPIIDSQTPQTPNKEKCTFTVEASPANAKVKLEADGVTTVEKDGIASIEVEKGTTVRYTVSLNDNSETGSCIVEHSQYIKVTLVEDGDNLTSPSVPPADEWDEEDPEIDFSK